MSNILGLIKIVGLVIVAIVFFAKSRYYWILFRKRIKSPGKSNFVYGVGYMILGIGFLGFAIMRLY